MAMVYGINKSGKVMKIGFENKISASCGTSGVLLVKSMPMFTKCFWIDLDDPMKHSANISDEFAEEVTRQG